MGRLIPAGSGVLEYVNRQVFVEGEEEAPQAEYKISQTSLESLAGLL